MPFTLDINLFYLAFAAYFAGFITFSLYAAFKTDIWSRIGVWAMLMGLIPHTFGFSARWLSTNHIPLSNMYEYMSLMSWMAVVTLLIVYYRYRRRAIGVFISPVVFMLMVAAALLPKEASQSLMPALRSVWLMIHVSLAALGTGCFLVSFAASAAYLLKQLDAAGLEPNRRIRAWRNAAINLIILPLVFAILLTALGWQPPAPASHFGPAGAGINAGGFISLLGLGFVIGAIYAAMQPLWSKINRFNGFGTWLFIAVVMTFLSGALVEGLTLKSGWLALTSELPGPRGGTVKSYWLIFEFIGAAYVIGLILAIALLPMLAGVSRLTSEKMSLAPDLLDEISYKAVSLGYPLYTIGALFAGAIWAEQAWGQFWSWDPKEVGSLITWLFYSGYLHARHQRGWSGRRAAVLAVAGFLVVLLSFFGNYFFGGLHAYG
ncbi:MAG: hypothetical protein FJY65_00020 [Calditrichaeota bacterium]|nr:hypothetical protein [Calditrichota bacterium]